MKRSTSKKTSLSISTIISGVISFFLIGLSVLLLTLSTDSSTHALHQLAENMQEKALSTSIANIDLHLKPAVDMSHVYAKSLQKSLQVQTDTDHNATSMIETASLNQFQMVEALKRFPSIYSLYFGDQNGHFYLIGRRMKNPSDTKTSYFTRTIKTVNQKRITTESWLSNQTNEILSSRTIENDTYDPRLRPWYIAAKKYRIGSWGNPYIFFITKKPGLTYSFPIIVDNQFKGVIGIDMELTSLSQFLSESMFSENTGLFILDNNNNIIAHSKTHVFKTAPQKKASLPNITSVSDPILPLLTSATDLSSGTAISKTVQTESETYKTMLTRHTFHSKEFLVGIYTPSGDYLAPLQKRTKQLTILTGIITLTSVLISLLVSWGLSRPLKQLSVATQQVQNLAFDKQIEVPSRYSEIITTVDNFNNMLDSLSSYEQANTLLAETLENAHLDTLYRLAVAAEYKDTHTAEHLTRVSNISVLLARMLELPETKIELIRHSSALHDVGKIGIPDNILMKPGKLTTDEYKIIQQHASIGAKMLENPSSDIMANARIVALNHHEWWDGGGYPNGISEKDIPLEGRIVAIGDVMDALLSKRTYKESFDFDKTINIISSLRGKQFDPRLIDILMSDLDTVHLIACSSEECKEKAG